ncbi:hypothetical protein ACFQZZ_29015 [Nocardia sp. GCM10030253]|uniref:hypothetical protein n=1 Tax=Nocardia sp. GCM10030253 TaxID=3273404 RepID=UPI003645AB91
MRKIRLLGAAVAAAGIVLAGSGIAAAETPVPAPTGSGNFATGLAKLLSTGSGGVKPLPTATVAG